MAMGVKCPKCGLTQLPGPTCKSCRTPLGASSSFSTERKPPYEPSSLSGGTHHRSIAVQSDKATKQQMIAGVCLILLGLAMEFIGGKFIGWERFLAGIAIIVVGLALIARARRHRLSSPRTTNRKWSWAVRLFVSLVTSLVLLMASCLGLVQWSHRKVNAFYAAAKDGMSLVEALEQHPRWFFINFGERLAEDFSTTPAGRADCGTVVPEKNGQMSFRPPQDPTRKQSSYRNLRDFFQADPQLFTKCPIASVTYPAFMFEAGTIDVQVDAQGKIILVKEPRYRD